MENYDVIKLSPDEFERLTKLLRAFGHAELIHPNGAVYLDGLAPSLKIALAPTNESKRWRAGRTDDEGTR
jgi:hypothetical protein